MRLRYGIDVDYFKEASADAYCKCYDLNIETPVNDISLQWFSSTLDLMFGKTDFFEISVSSTVEDLSFVNVYKQFISAIFPHNEGLDFLPKQKNEDKFWDESKISLSSLCFEVPKLETDLYLERLITMPDIALLADTCSTEFIQLSSETVNTLDVCQDTKEELVNENIKNVDNQSTRENATETCEGHDAFESKENLHFEIYMDFLDHLDFHTINSDMWLNEDNHIQRFIKQQPHVILDAVTLPCSTFMTSMDYLGMEYFPELSSNKVETEFLSNYYGNTNPSKNQSSQKVKETQCFHRFVEESNLDEERQIILEEKDFLDYSYVQPFTWISKLSATLEISIDKSIELKSILQRSFDVLIVSHDLTLSDRVFTSLPTPLFPDNRYEPLGSFVLHIILPQEMKCTSASDWLYLDWHHSIRGRCNNLGCVSLQRKIEMDEIYSFRDSTSKSMEVVSNTFDILEFLEDNQASHCNITQLEIMETAGALDAQEIDFTSVSSTGQKNLQNPDESKKSSLFRSGSISNDLSLFLSARKGQVKDLDQSEVKHCNSKDLPSSGLNSSSSNMSSATDCFANEIQTHQIEISNFVVDILESIQSCSKRIQETQDELKQILGASRSLKDLFLSQAFSSKLISLIIERTSQSYTLSNDSVLRGLVALHVLYVSAFNTCFYGVVVAFLYLDKITQTLFFLKDILQTPYFLLRDAYERSENGQFEEHPLMQFFETTLKFDFQDQKGLKILLVSEKTKNFPLCKKLLSLNLKIHEFQWNRSYTGGTTELKDIDQLNQEIMTITSQCDGLIVSHKYITALFPIELFNVIVEYSDSSLSTNFPAIINDTKHRCKIYLLRVRLNGREVRPPQKEDSTNFMALVKEEETKCWLASVLGMDDEMDVMTLEKPVKDAQESKPKEKKCNLVNEISESHVISPETLVMHDEENNQTNNTSKGLSDFVPVIVIANITAFRKEMIASRRSLYQKIISLEKNGLQVIEREYHLPVDLIFSPATSLTLYTLESLQYHMSSLEERTLTSCMSNIADSFLMSLSFSFELCILIFEGKDAFLKEVMEASDDLYAAAAGLGIHFQCFVSDSMETTDDIVLNCIRRAMAVNRFTYPVMLESETLAESFLTKFRSINPFSAHAILSCSDSFSNFLSAPKEYQTLLVKKFGVPEKSLCLFNSQVTSGELGETKSGTTECSSTLNSPFHTDGRRIKNQSYAEESDITVENKSNKRQLHECLGTESSSVSCYEILKRQQLEHSSFHNTKNHERIQTSGPLCETIDCLPLGNDVHYDTFNQKCVLGQDPSYGKSDIIDQICLRRSNNIQRDAFKDSTNIFRHSHDGTFEMSINQFPNTNRASCNYESEIPAMQMENTSINQYLPFSTTAPDDWDFLKSPLFCNNDSDKTQKETLRTNDVHKTSFSNEFWQATPSNWKQTSAKNAVEKYQFEREQRICDNSENLFSRNSPCLKYMQNKLRESLHRSGAANKEYCISDTRKPYADSIVQPSSIWIDPNAPSTSNRDIFYKYRYRSPSVRSKEECKRKWQAILNYQTPFSTPRTRQRNLSTSLQSSTPSDKIAKQRLTFIRGGNTKQSRLIWSNEF